MLPLLFLIVCQYRAIDKASHMVNNVPDYLNYLENDTQCSVEERGW